MIGSNVSIGVFRHGELVQEIRVHNDLVDVGRTHLVSLIAGVGARPNQMRVGTSSAPTLANMTNLQNSVATVPIDRRAERTFGIEFQAVIDLATANGNTLREGATFAQGIMLARFLIVPEIVKDAATRVVLSHLFTVS